MSMSIADYLRGYSKAYPIDIFPECDRKLLKLMQDDYQGMSGRIWAESGRNFARIALEGADELDRLEMENERLEENLGEACVLLGSYQNYIVANDYTAQELKEKISKLLGERVKEVRSRG